nr:immunoglobulin heavy chain junction region [Macaca mulatta]MOW75401.1 immunoglobulin heavy chain junction region [Macaca mulatta]MOW75436.1 immunoglobulin heavy chain junction region [Macaca mulatta]MOW75513.1 immunoglobulin heavy chain junction region [Macaca mulatta]MOW75515.1 immunoglobulin heavy chain junction region [Macaca mulatta]
CARGFNLWIGPLDYW